MIDKSGLAIPWSQDFVERWSRSVAKSLNLTHNGAWINGYGRPERFSRRYRAPFLSYSDVSPKTDLCGLEGEAPLRRNDRVHALSPDPKMISESVYVVMRLEIAGQTADEVFKTRLKSVCRNRIRKAQKSNMEFVWHKKGEPSGDAWPILKQIYRRLGSPIMPRRLLDSLAEDGLIRFGTAYHQGRGVAMITYVSDGRIAWIPWCGALPEAHQFCPNHMTHWSALQEACFQECEIFDFGRSPFGGGTFEFKRKWGAKEVALVSHTSGGWAPLKTGYASHPMVSATWRLLPTKVSDVLGPPLHCLVAL